jgi:toxin YoeB
LDLSKKRKPQPDPSFSDPNPVKRVLVFDDRFLEDLTYWVETDRKTALRLLTLVEEIGRNPFSGTEKPERLKYQDGNVWSRRLTEKDRIVYLVAAERVEFLQGRYHYSDR